MNCKPGDLAIIIHDPQTKGRDLGKLVEVIQSMGRDEDYDYCWECQPLSPLAGWDDDGRYVENLDLINIPDTWLKPVSGLPLDEEVPDKVVISNEV